MEDFGQVPWATRATFSVGGSSPVLLLTHGLSVAEVIKSDMIIHKCTLRDLSGKSASMEGNSFFLKKKKECKEKQSTDKILAKCSTLEEPK